MIPMASYHGWPASYAVNTDTVSPACTRYFQVGGDTVIRYSQEPNTDGEFGTATELNKSGEPWFVPAHVSACSSSRNPPGWTWPPTHTRSASVLALTFFWQVWKVAWREGAVVSLTAPMLVGL